MSRDLIGTQDKILRDLENRFDQWLIKRKTNRNDDLHSRSYVTTTATTTTTATRESKKLSTTESTSSSSLPEDGMAMHHECEQDSAYFSEEDLDLENLSSLIGPNIKKWQMDSDVAIGGALKMIFSDSSDSEVNEEKGEEGDDAEDEDGQDDDDICVIDK